MNDVLIEIKDLSFHFGPKPILKKISTRILRGEALSIIGSNGAGKTTLLRCLCRILSAAEGCIELNGRPIESYSRKELARWMSYVPQADGRLLPFTVYEFVMMGRYPHLSPFSLVKSSDRAVVEDALARTGTSEFADRYLDTLSGGERQKVLIAAALAQEAKILLLDEPTTFLDYKHQSEVQEILWQVKRDCGVTLIMVTHDINRASLIGERMLALKKGEVVFCGTPSEAMTSAILEKIYDQPFLFVNHPHTGSQMVVPEGVHS